MAAPVPPIGGEERWRLLLREYQRLEASFLTLTEYVPLVPDLTAANFAFGSPRGAAFGLDSCTYVETVFKDLLKGPRYSNYPEVLKARGQEESIDTYRVAFEPILHLSARQRTTIEHGLTVSPFRAFASNVSPDWFKRYSRLKHSRIDLAAEWTMLDSLQSLAALTLLLRTFFDVLEVRNVTSAVFKDVGFPLKPGTTPLFTADHY